MCVTPSCGVCLCFFFSAKNRSKYHKCAMMKWTKASWAFLLSWIFVVILRFLLFTNCSCSWNDFAFTKFMYNENEFQIRGYVMGKKRIDYWFVRAPKIVDSNAIELLCQNRCDAKAFLGSSSSKFNKLTFSVHDFSIIEKMPFSNQFHHFRSTSLSRMIIYIYVCLYAN